jgi:type IV pilus assembly protein PilW
MKPLNKQLGLTLIELMVTLAISTVILAGVVNLYVSSLTQSRITTNLAAMQESGRFALEIMSRDLRMASYAGCGGYDASKAEADESAYVLYKRAADNNALLGLAGNEWQGSGYASTTLDPMVSESSSRLGTGDGGWVTSGTSALADNYDEAIGSSDVLQVWTTAELAVDVLDYKPASGQLDVTVASGHGLQAGDVVMFSDCGLIIIGQICSSSANNVRISSGSAQDCNNDFNIGKDIADIESDAQLAVGDSAKNLQGWETYSYRDAVYFVGKRDAYKKTPPSLFRGTDGVAREMVEGVENMQILYGVDVDHEAGKARTADKYVPADQVMDWNNVVSVRVSVLIRSFEKGVASNDYEFDFNGRTYTATDGYLRQSYSTTIALRNRTGGYVQGVVTQPM